MSDESSTLRAVAWRDVFPGLLIFRSFGLSIRASILTLATIGVLLAPLGWWVGAHLFLPSETRAAAYRQHAWKWPSARRAEEYKLPSGIYGVVNDGWRAGHEGVRRWFAGWQHFLSLPLTLGMTAFLTFGALWTLVVWAFLGGAMGRIAIAELGRDERVSFGSALRHVTRKCPSYLGAPLLPLAGILFGLVLLALLGLIMRANFGVALAGLIWLFVLLGGLILTILLVGLAIGWPLMWTALGAELDSDAFEAVSRGYTYTIQRPLRFLVYVLIALLLGGLGYLLVYHVAEILLAICRNTVLWSAGAERQPDLLPWFYRDAPRTDDSYLLAFGGWLILLANGLVRSIVVAYGFSFFFCAAAAIYLLLRRDIDDQPFDDTFSDEEEEVLQMPPVPPELGTAAPKPEA